MKKIIAAAAASVFLIGSQVGAGALDSAWSAIDINDGTGEQLVLGTGLADDLDACGNGKPFYTVFMPVNEALDAFLDEEGITVPQILSQPAVALALLNDHIARGSFSFNELQNPSVTRISTKSGFVVTKSIIDGNVYIGGNLILGSQQTCNGHIHWISGIIDSSTQVPTTGLNTGTPTTTAPVESAGLPNTL